MDDMRLIEELLGDDHEALQSIQCSFCYEEGEEVMQLTSADGFCSMYWKMQEDRLPTLLHSRLEFCA